MDIIASVEINGSTSLDLESLSISVIKPFVNFSDLITEGTAITINQSISTNKISTERSVTLGPENGSHCIF